MAGCGLTAASTSSTTVSTPIRVFFDHEVHPLYLLFELGRFVADQHHTSGHAGAIVQARQLGDELYVGVHSDEAILENKGPSVMTMQERYVPSSRHTHTHTHIQDAHF